MNALRPAEAESGDGERREEREHERDHDRRDSVTRNEFVSAGQELSPVRRSTSTVLVVAPGELVRPEVRHAGRASALLGRNDVLIIQ